MDGLYDVRSHQASSSLGCVDRRLFGQYRGLEFDVTSENSLSNYLASCFISRVPGLAFWNRYSFLELQQSDLLQLAWTDIKRQFFQTAVFIGCGNGEIELGFSCVSHVSNDAEIQTDVHVLLVSRRISVQSHQVEQKILPSSSSCLRSLSTGSSDTHFSYSALVPEMLLQQENDHNGVIKAILHVKSSPSSNNNSSLVLEQDPPNIVIPERVSAFKSYRPSRMGHYKPSLRRQSLLKRSFELLRGLYFMRTRGNNEQSCHIGSQFLHVMSERRRREKLNRNFEALKSLLPPETKALWLLKEWVY
ncbi:putative transcription factor bHLH041 [Neltuma alba]|uniref:putative transcription factor bHLH041 n=1 Tax=Neltuma alba TaxID=207710 RepID=UPI0010A433B3|nr:putative transcription factor bHLH041 [Prosopis alba]